MQHSNTDSCILLKFYIKPHPPPGWRCPRRWLYLIEILHQTTTAPLTSFLVVPLYLIEILHQTTTAYAGISRGCRCILLKFYIKPQLLRRSYSVLLGCILLKFYIKPQLFCRHFPSYDSCILLKFYIKPQPICFF